MGRPKKKPPVQDDAQASFPDFSALGLTNVLPAGMSNVIPHNQQAQTVGGKKGAKKKVPPVQDDAQPVFPLFSSTGPMNVPSVPSSSVTPHTQQQQAHQTLSHSLAPSLPTAPQAVMQPLGAPPTGVSASGNPLAGTSNVVPTAQQAQTIGKQGTKKKMPFFQNQNAPAVFPLFSSTGPMNVASGPSVSTSSAVSNTYQPPKLSHSLEPSHPAPTAVINPYDAPPTGVVPPGASAQGKPPADTSSAVSNTYQPPKLSHSLAPSHPAPTPVMNPYDAPFTRAAVPAQGKPPARTPSSVKPHTHQQAQPPSQNPAPALPAPPVVMGARSPDGLPPYGMSARTIRKIAKRLAGETPSPEPEPPRMHYPNPAIAPATAEEHSIYPINSQGRRDRGDHDPEAALNRFTDQKVGKGDPEFDLQHEVRKAGLQLWLDKGKPMRPPPPAGPAPGMSDMMRTLDQISVNRSENRETSSGDPTPSQKGKEKSTVPDEPMMSWDGAADSDEEDMERDFTMFEDTPRDASIVPEREEWKLPPYDQPDSPIEPALLIALSTLPTWSPELDPAYQVEAQWNLEKWNDFRFKAPKTAADIASLQQALEMTRMDFWLQNPYENYPDDLSRFKGESYGSQHRRLQHAFCRLWREFDADGGPAPELYRLPVWIFGFEACYWRPANWGMDKRSEVYNRGLAEMAAEKDAKGLQRVDYRKWKARLEQEVRVVVAEAKTPLGLFAGSRGRQ